MRNQISLCLFNASTLTLFFSFSLHFPVHLVYNYILCMQSYNQKHSDFARFFSIIFDGVGFMMFLECCLAFVSVTQTNVNVLNALRYQAFFHSLQMYTQINVLVHTYTAIESGG